MFNARTFLTWPFIVLVLSNLAAWLATTGSTVTSHNAYLYTALSAGAYAIARGLAKWNTDGKPFYLQTEFWVVVVGGVVAIVGDLQGHVSDSLLKEILAGLAAVTAIMNGASQAPAKAVSRDHGFGEG